MVTFQNIFGQKNVSFDHLEVFGCRVSVYISKNERSKLDSKAKQCIFLGYTHEELGYRLWDLMNKEIIRSRDIVFFEDENIEDLDQTKKPKSIKKQQASSNPHESFCYMMNTGKRTK